MTSTAHLTYPPGKNTSKTVISQQGKLFYNNIEEFGPITVTTTTNKKATINL